VFKESGLFFKIKSDFFKDSGSIQEIYMTGKFNRNIFGERVIIDNLWRQMKLSGFPIKYIGYEFPMFSMGGGTGKDSSWDKTKTGRLLKIL
jgi:hypothetical protein